MCSGDADLLSTYFDHLFVIFSVCWVKMAAYQFLSVLSYRIVLEVLSLDGVRCRRSRRLPDDLQSVDHLRC